MASLIIEQGVQRQFHQLAEEMHRTESDIIHEALSGYLAALKPHPGFINGNADDLASLSWEQTWQPTL